jgi:hypothetical protein
MTLLHSCQKAAELISQSLDEPLDMVDKLRLRMHLSMCGNCRNVQEQLNLIHKMGGKLALWIFAATTRKAQSSILGFEQALTRAEIHATSAILAVCSDSQATHPSFGLPGKKENNHESTLC